MNDHLEQYLIEKFPHYYKDGERTMQFSHGDGWFWIVFQLSQDLTKADPQRLVKPLQIKEKLGRFNYYFMIYGTPIDLDIKAFHEKIDKIVKEFTLKADTVCELCGETYDIKREAPKGGYWIRTLCKQCRDDLAEKE
jgi:hypothetical protein